MTSRDITIYLVRTYQVALTMRQGRGSEATEAVFCLQAKKPLHTGVRTGCHYLISLCACQCVCNIRRFYWLRELYEADFHKPGIYGSGRVWANAWDVFSRIPSRVWRGRRAAVNFVVYFGWGEFFFVFSVFFRLFFLRTHTSCCKYEAILPQLPLY